MNHLSVEAVVTVAAFVVGVLVGKNNAKKINADAQTLATSAQTAATKVEADIKKV